MAYNIASPYCDTDTDTDTSHKHERKEKKRKFEERNYIWNKRTKTQKQLMRPKKLETMNQRTNN